MRFLAFFLFLVSLGANAQTFKVDGLNDVGAATFVLRPTFNGATPWDSANFTPSNYLTTAAAAGTYLTIGNAASTYLTQSAAASTYETQTAVSNTYLAQTSAASTYLTQANAAGTYLTQASAALGYLPTTGGTATSPTFTNGSTGATSSIPAVTITNASNPVTGELQFFPALPANAFNTLVKAGDAALISNGSPASQASVGFVIGKWDVAAGTEQGIRIGSTGVDTNTFNVHGVASFDGRPIFNTVTGGNTPWDNGNLPNPLTTDVAASTYLTQSNAAATYVTATSANATYLSQATALATYAQLTGGVITGSFAFNSPSSGAFRGMGIRTNNLQRWNIGTDVTESGSGNNGGDFQFYAYNDAGAFTGTAATIIRATRQFQFSLRPTFAGATPWDSGNFTPPYTGTSGSIGGSALGAGACATGTVSIPSATTSMAVVATPVTYPGASIYWRGYVSSAGTVTVAVCAAVAATPTSSAYNVRVIP